MVGNYMAGTRGLASGDPPRHCN